MNKNGIFMKKGIINLYRKNIVIKVFISSFICLFGLVTKVSVGETTGAVHGIEEQDMFYARFN